MNERKETKKTNKYKNEEYKITREIVVVEVIRVILLRQLPGIRSHWPYQ